MGQHLARVGDTHGNSVRVDSKEASIRFKRYVSKMLLYPYDVIKEFAMMKTWFKSGGALIFISPYNLNRREDVGAGINDHNWASAIFALDVKHVRFFFPKPKSYVKSDFFDCGSSKGINLKPLFPELAHIFRQVNGSWNQAVREGHSGVSMPSVGCFNQDEYVFIKRFKEMLPKTNLMMRCECFHRRPRTYSNTGG